MSAVFVVSDVVNSSVVVSIALQETVVSAIVFLAVMSCDESFN